MSKSRTDAVTATTISAKEAAYTELTSGSYELSSGGSGTIQARILCQPAGSSVYYQDSRLATGVLHIDMTKTVQYG